MKPQFLRKKTWIIRRVVADCAPERITNPRQTIWTAGWSARSAGIGKDETSSLPHYGLIHSWCSNSGTVRPTGRTKSWARRTGTNETVIVGTRSAGPASCRRNRQQSMAARAVLVVTGRADFRYDGIAPVGVDLAPSSRGVSRPAVSTSCGVTSPCANTCVMSPATKPQKAN